MKRNAILWHQNRAGMGALLVMFFHLVGPSHVEANIEGVPITSLTKVADLIAVVEIGETKALAGARTSRGLVPEITMARMKVVEILKCPTNIRPLISTSNGMMATSVSFPETSAGGIALRSGKFLAKQSRDTGNDED